MQTTTTTLCSITTKASILVAARIENIAECLKCAHLGLSGKYHENLGLAKTYI